MTSVTTDAGAMRAAMLPTLSAKSLALANVGVQACQRYSRVRTGEMRRGFNAKPKGQGGATWGNDVEHTVYNEFGTRRMSAQPMVRPSVNDVRAAL